MGSDQELVTLAWPLLLIMSVMLVLSLASISILSSLRAYVNSEDQWAKAERQASSELRRYTLTAEESDFRRFRAELAVPLGDRAARIELQRQEADIEIAARGLLAGRIHPDDVPGMIRLFRLFHAHPVMAHAIEQWTAGDVLIEQLAQLGEQIHQEITSGHPDSRHVAMLLAASEQLHMRVAPLEDGFSVSIGTAARQMANLLLAFLSICGAALVCIGIAISRGNLRRSEKVEAAVRAKEREFAARLEYQATHDLLTGLTNRQEFEVRLRRAIEDQQAGKWQHALLYLDLDQFKVINDTCGHAAGDELIRQVAWVVRQQMRDGDVLARLGGDEFGALLPNTEANEAVALAEKIRRRIADLRFNWRGKLFVVNASVGVLALDESLPNVGDALSAADQACYLAKDSGRNRVQVYRTDDAQMQSRRGGDSNCCCGWSGPPASGSRRWRSFPRPSAMD